VKKACFALILGLLCLAWLPLGEQPVTKYEGNDTTLNGRWEWGWSQARHSKRDKECWIGYSIRRLMDEDSYIMSGNVLSGTLETTKSLYFRIAGDTSDDRTRAKALRSQGEPKIFKRMKDIALFFSVSQDSGTDFEIRKVDECTMDLSFNFRGKPLYWLGRFGDDESVSLLKTLFHESATARQKKEIVGVIGLHQRSGLVYPFLNAVLESSEPDDVRAMAVFWMGEQGNPECLRVLTDAAESDESLKVRQEAVFAISRLDSDESTDTLISLARTANDPKVRGKAAFWLGQKASRNVVATLEGIIADDEETEVQRQALFALAQIKDAEGVERLIHIAMSHPNPRIRKQAIQLLGQSEDPRAWEALIRIVKK